MSPAETAAGGVTPERIDLPGGYHFKRAHGHSRSMPLHAPNGARLAGDRGWDLVYIHASQATFLTKVCAEIVAASDAALAAQRQAHAEEVAAPPDLETAEGGRDRFRRLIGDSYTPHVWGHNRALHDTSIRAALDMADRSMPEVADVLRAMLWHQVVDNRALHARQAERKAEADAAGVRAENDRLRGLAAALRVDLANAAGGMAQHTCEGCGAALMLDEEAATTTDVVGCWPYVTGEDKHGQCWRYRTEAGMDRAWPACALAAALRPAGETGAEPSLPLSEPPNASSDKSVSETPFQPWKSAGASARSDVVMSNADPNHRSAAPQRRTAAPELADEKPTCAGNVSPDRGIVSAAPGSGVAEGGA